MSQSYLITTAYYLQKYYCDMNWIKVIILSLCFFKAAISEINVRNFYYNQNQKIVDGEDAKQGQFPYQVNYNHQSNTYQINSLDTVYHTLVVIL